MDFIMFLMIFVKTLEVLQLGSSAALCMLQDIKSFVALSESALAATHPNLTGSNEIWGYYPDDWPLKGLHAGDTRAALTPFLAHEVSSPIQAIMFRFALV